MKDFNQLKVTFEQLEQQAAELDRRRGEHHQPLFDERLFRGQSRLLIPCVKEATSTFDAINREKQNGLLTSARAEYLTERLFAQLNAIQRELATTTIRGNEPKHSSYYRKPINTLYQELAQHQDWERRLKDMVREKEYLVAHSSFSEQQAAQKALFATEQRLKRCQAAKLKLENQITYRERNQ